MPRHHRLAAGLIAAPLLAGALLAAASPVDAATRLPCRAAMSNSHPTQYSTVSVDVHTAARAAVRTVAHYRTTDTTHTGKAGSSGAASIVYRISRATKGYRVVVDVTVTSGHRSGSCSTSFTPR